MKKQPKIVRLEIEEGILNGVDAIAFVENPAIEIDFLAFEKQSFETYNDYPQKAIDNAKRGIELNKENNQKCATQVGKVRAQQLANGENLSLDTIRRMRAFLIRQKDNYELARDRKDYNACGYISYLLWGGEEALPWAEKKLRQAGEEFDLDVSALPNYVSEVDEEEIKVEQLSAIENEILEHFLLEKFIETELFDDEWIDDLTDDLEDVVYNALLGVGIDEQDLVDEGYDFKKAVRLDADFNHDKFVASIGEIKSASKENQPSVDDYGVWKVLYRYTRYNGSESFGDNSREFCKNVIKAKKWFRKEDINKLTIAGANEGFGLNGQRFYDIFTFKGGKNCQHYWQAFLIPRDDKASDRERPSAILDRRSDATSLNEDTLTKLLADGRLTFSQEQMDEQQIVATPIMVPNKLITRKDENGDKYYVYFTEETIKQIAYAFAKSKNTDKINYEHDVDSPIDSIYLAESWIVDEPKNDKSNVFGYNVPKGSWFGLFKVNNNEFWNDYIKSGKVKGVSVEGYFVNKLTSLV